jgi:large exoprotein involved in heme utilization and adhesion
LTIEGGLSKFPTGISSRAQYPSSGDAGAIVIEVHGKLRLLGGGVITSRTNDVGRGGEVTIRAGSIDVDGLESQVGAVATRNSTGQPGSVTVIANGGMTLTNGGALTIENSGNNANPTTVAASKLEVQAAVLTLDGGAIKANSTGNVAAGTIQINASERLNLSQSSITTSANTGNGGSINVSGGKLVTLNNSQITTSVLGATGNGGDIELKADALILNSGFIQANTAASNASGGLVNIDVKTLIASGSTLFVGGQSAYDYTPGVFSFNVIQAAAPTGVSGAIDITSPVLDLSGSLGRLNAQVMDDIVLGRNPCQVSAGSSLSQAGRGGLPVSYRGLLRAEVAPMAPSTPSALPASALSGRSPTALVRLPQPSCL